MSNDQEHQYLAAFGKRVAAVRRAHGLTQEELAEAANLMPLTIGFIEQGRRWPRITTLHRIAGALNVPVNELFKEM